MESAQTDSIHVLTKSIMSDVSAGNQSHVIYLLNNLQHKDTHRLPYLELNMLQKAKFFGIHPEILQDLGIVHEVGKMIWNGVVTEAHHLLGGVDDHGLVDAGPSFFGTFLQ